MEEHKLLKARDVARLLGLGRSTVYALMDSGALPVVEIGRARRVPADALPAFIEARTKPVRAA